MSGAHLAIRDTDPDDNLSRLGSPLEHSRSRRRHTSARTVNGQACAHTLDQSHRATSARPAQAAARWLMPTKAMILLSDRYKADDSFWFSFFHEAGHILLHSKNELFVSEADDGANATEQEEDEANAFAANQLIPRQYARELHQLRTDEEVVRFADRIGIAPGIVVGRLHNDGTWGWNRGNRLRQKMSFDDMFVD